MTEFLAVSRTYAEAAANLPTNPALDPFGKIHEFKSVDGHAGGEKSPLL